MEDFFDSEWFFDVFISENQFVYRLIVCLLRVTSLSISKPFKLGDILKIFKRSKYSNTRRAAGKSNLYAVTEDLFTG